MSDLSLFSDFPLPDRVKWEAMVKKALRGASADSLEYPTEEGLSRGPLTTQAERPKALASWGRAGAPLLVGRPWHISAPVRDPDLGFANEQLLADLRGGASAVRIEIGAGGLGLDDASDVKRIFEQVYLDLVPVTFAPGRKNAALTKILRDIKSLKGVHLDLGLDPLDDAELIIDMTKDCPDTWRAMTLNARAVHDHGGTPAQEIGGLAATLAQAIRLFGAAMVARHMNIEVSVSQDAHLATAKLRAMRRVSARIFAAFDAAPTALPVHAVSAARMMQNADPWTNLLRVMSASFGAVCGGADFICARPFTDGLGHATPFGYRIARNMQLMMMEESQLGQVSDPAFGSYFHEKLTEDLAQAGWAVFQEIEAVGGIQDALANGTFQNMIGAAVTAREKRDEPILGVTLHPAENVRPAQLRKIKP